MGHGEAVQDSFLSLVDALAHGKNKIMYFSGLFWDCYAGNGKEGMLANFFFFLVVNIIFFYSKNVFYFVRVSSQIGRFSHCVFKKYAEVLNFFCCCCSWQQLFNFIGKEKI